MNLRHALQAFGVFVFGAFALSACDYQHPKTVLEDRGNEHVDVRSLSFANVYARVLGPSCCHCHGTQGGLSLETYDRVVANLNGVKERALIQKDMPKQPTAPLDQDQIDLLAAWIRAGAPLNANDPRPSPSPSPSPWPSPSPEPSWEPIVTTFGGVKDRVLVPHCAGCHNPEDRTDFDTEENLIDFGLIVPGKPELSELYRRVRLPLDDEDHMPPDKWLSHEGVAAMHAWILHLGDPKPSPTPSPTPSPAPSRSP